MMKIIIRAACSIMLGLIIIILAEYAIDPFYDWIRPPANQASHLAPESLQSISSEIAAVAKVPAVPVFMGSGKAVYGHADCHRAKDFQTTNCSIQIRDDAYRNDENDSAVVKALIAHEYGHVLEHADGREPSHFHYYLAPFLVITACIVAATVLWGWPPAIFLIGVSVAGGTMMHLLDRDIWSVSAGIAEFAPIAFVAVVLHKKGSISLRILTLSTVLMVCIAGFFVGVEYRNKIYRAQETQADQFASVAVGPEAMQELFCRLQADERNQLGNNIGQLDTRFGIPFQRWVDTHPTLSARANLLKITLKCADTPKLTKT